MRAGHDMCERCQTRVDHECLAVWTRARVTYLCRGCFHKMDERMLRRLAKRQGKVEGNG